MALFQQFFERADEVQAFAAGAAASGFIRFPSVGEIVSRAGTVVGATIVLDDNVVATPITFEFIRGGSPGSGNTAVDIVAATTKQGVASALSTAIAGTSLALTPAVVGTGNDAYLTIVNQTTGPGGNIPIVANNKNSRPFDVRGLEGGSTAVADDAIISIFKVPGGWHLWWTA